MRALVLGGGGITGIAWELGLVAGLADAGVRLADADLVIGTSAGSVVGAQLLSGTPVEELYERQLRPATGEIRASVGIRGAARWMLASFSSRDEQAVRARLGRLALSARAAATVDERREVIASRLPSPEWPTRARLLVTAVEASTGEFRAFDRDSGVPLIDAVAASCAVPMVWPPIPIDGRAYVDGGVRSPANADLAAGAEQVVVLAPIARAARASGRVDRQLAGLGPNVRSTSVSPDALARTAFGRNSLDPSRRALAARAGRDQAPTVLDAVRPVWT
jgi:NTE family protein